MRLLGMVIQNNLKWKANTNSMVKRAYKKLWMISRLKKHGANLNDLKEVYTKQVRSILEFGVPVWNSSLTNEESADIERVQKAFLHLALGAQYVDYENALDLAELDTLKDRRVKLCTTFARKSARHPKHKHWFEINQKLPSTRSIKPEYKHPLYRLERFRRSPIPYLTRLLNKK